MIELLTNLGVLFSVAAGCIAIVKPVIKLNSTITKLNDNMDYLNENMKKSADARKRLWEHNDEQDEVLSNHELRISILERTNKDGE